MDWDKEPEINKGCETQSREDMIQLAEAAFEKYKDRNIIVATHHPFRSYGSHGGYFNLKNHLFPGTMWKKNFYLPLPGLGTILMWIRSAGVSRQDVNNKHNKALSKALVNAAKKHGESIFVAGHEHNLQYIKDEGQHFVVSGSGSKTSSLANGKKALFGYARNGFSKLEFFEDGSVWIEFWVADGDKEMGTKIFECPMK